MAVLRLKLAFWLSLLVQSTSALQVTPNSPCAALCIDDPTGNVSDPDASSTQGTDIVCSDSSYTSKPVGQKFKSCMSCLQNSSATAVGESDQAWFIYNLRFAIDSCLFDFENATETISTPCSTDLSCGRLSQALENGNLDPATESTWGYCSADTNSFLGRFNDICVQCLMGGTEQYLANFMTALKAGCTQRPEDGWILGLDGSVFSSTLVNITFAQNGISSSTTSNKHGLSRNSIIGISVGLGILLIITSVTLFFCWRKTRGVKQMKKLRSPLDSRFGAINITSPNNGAYGNPYANPPISVSHQINTQDLSTKERQALGMDVPIALERPPVRNKTIRQQEPSPPIYSTSPQYSPPMIPTHKAYLNTISPDSPATTISSDTNYQMSTHSSPRTSPRAPPPLSVPFNGNTLPPIQVHSSESPNNFSRPRQSPPLQRGPPVTLQAPSRSGSALGHRLTNKLGLGSANASKDDSLQISRPIVDHAARFDFELADQERRRHAIQDQLGRRRKEDSTPESAQSEEQWPGSY